MGFVAFAALTLSLSAATAPFAAAELSGCVPIVKDPSFLRKETVSAPKTTRRLEVETTEFRFDGSSDESRFFDASTVAGDTRDLDLAFASPSFDPTRGAAVGPLRTCMMSPGDGDACRRFMEKSMAVAVRQRDAHRARILAYDLRAKSEGTGRWNKTARALKSVGGDSVSDCCRIASLSSICGDPTDDSDDGIVVDFDVSDFGPQQLTSSSSSSSSPKGTPPHLGDPFAGNKVALTTENNNIRKSFTNPSNGYELKTYWLFTPYPATKVVSTELYLNDDRGNRECNVFQTSVNHGEPTFFDSQTECIHVCTRRDFCSRMSFCSRALPPDTPGRIPSKFYYGMVLFDDGPDGKGRAIDFAYLELRSEFSEHHFVQLTTDCGPDDTLYTVRGTVFVYGNPQTAKYQLVIRDLSWGETTRGEGPAGQINGLILPFSCPEC